MPTSGKITDIDGFLAYLDELATWVPRERDFVPHILELYYMSTGHRMTG